jgi:hypothetical protein
MRNFLGIFPNKLKTNQLQARLVSWLSIALMVLLCYNIFNTAKLEQQIAFLKLDASHQTLPENATDAELKQFENTPYCGWKIDDGASRKSYFYATNQIYVKKQLGTQTLDVCVYKISKTDQIAFCVIIYLILSFIIYRKFLQKPTAHEEVPTPTEG